MPSPIKNGRVVIYDKNITPDKRNTITKKIAKRVTDRSADAILLDDKENVVPHGQTPTHATTPGGSKYDDFTDFTIEDKKKKRKIRVMFHKNKPQKRSSDKRTITKKHLMRVRRIMPFNDAEFHLGEYTLEEIAKNRIKRDQLPSQTSVMNGVPAGNLLAITAILKKNPDIDLCDDRQLQQLSEEVNSDTNGDAEARLEAHLSHGHAVSLTPNYVNPQIPQNLPAATMATNFSSKRPETAALELANEGKYPKTIFSGAVKFEPNPKPGGTFAGQYIPVAKSYHYRFYSDLEKIKIEEELNAHRKSVLASESKHVTKAVVETYFEQAAFSPSNK